MSALADPRGLKRVCVSCGIRFYDLNKRPITCPNCETEFTGEIKVKTRRGKAAANDADESIKAAAEKPVIAVGEEEDDIAAEEGVVSLDDLESDDDLDDDDDGAMDLDEESDDLDDLVVDEEDLGDLEDLEPDEEVEGEDTGADDAKAKAGKKKKK